jgi:surface antigen
MKLSSMRATARLVALTVACFVSVGHASNLQFLNSAPASNFDDKDWQLLRQAVSDLLDNAEHGDTGTWKNQENGHHGELVLIKTYEAYGTTCRRVKITNEAGDFRATSVRDLCKDKAGEWKILK